MGALAWLMNLDFAAGGGAVSGGGAPRRKWHSPEIESLLATEALIRGMWAEGLLTDAKRDKALERLQENLKRAEYGKRFPEQPGKSNPWKNKSRANKRRDH